MHNITRYISLLILLNACLYADFCNDDFDCLIDNEYCYSGECCESDDVDECGICEGGNVCGGPQCDVGEYSENISSLPFVLIEGSNVNANSVFTNNNGYTFGITLTETTSLDISLCGSRSNYGFDTYLRLYDANNCDNLTQITSNDDASGGYTCDNYHSYDSAL